MTDSTRERLLKIALVAFGAIFFLIYPPGLVWPWSWAVARRRRQILFADDLRGLCGPGCLPDRRVSQSLATAHTSPPDSPTPRSK
jgi:hypothetical protein